MQMAGNKSRFVFGMSVHNGLDRKSKITDGNPWIPQKLSKYIKGIEKSSTSGLSKNILNLGGALWIITP